jgi:hypothetical protein
MGGPPKKHGWRRKRTWAALLLWLAVAYPLSLGPFMYAFYRGWVPDAVLPAADRVYGPFVRVVERVPWLDEPLDAYCGWWGELGSAAERRAAGGEELITAPSLDGDYLDPAVP